MIAGRFRNPRPTSNRRAVLVGSPAFRQAFGPGYGSHAINERVLRQVGPRR